MIEFKGEMSEPCQQYIIKSEARRNFLVALIAALVVLVPFFIIILTAPALQTHRLLMTCLCVPTLLFWLIGSAIPPRRKYRNHAVPDRVAFLDDGTMVSESEKFQIVEFIADVTEVLDKGEWYHVCVSYRRHPRRFICEKRLLTEGTLEEFEKMFEDKIIRDFV